MTATNTISTPAIRERAEKARADGREIVVVQGLGFVGSAMAIVTASASQSDGSPHFFVIGVDENSPLGRAKVARLNSGLPVVAASDPLIAELTRSTVLDAGSFVATVDAAVYELADVVVVDLPLDAHASDDDVAVDLEPFEAAIRDVGRRMPPGALVLIETTVPPGTTERVILPILRREFEERRIDEEPLVAHSYERVMPGPRYVESIRSFWRCFAGASPRSGARARAFLERVVDVQTFELTELASPRASELAKVLENSYRATNIAFIDEWSRAAEEVGINLFEVIGAIRKREGTHDNIRRPGFGVGGYCLPKDGLLAEWGLRNLLQTSQGLPMTREAIRVNRRMPLHALEIVAKELGVLSGARIGVAGISYLAGVGDTRNSPAATLVDAAKAAGATVAASDPFVDHWPERPDVQLCPLERLLRWADAVVFGVDHDDYRRLRPLNFGARPLVVVDGCGVLANAFAEALRGAGHRVRGVGRGDWNTSGESR